MSECSGVIKGIVMQQNSECLTLQLLSPLSAHPSTLALVTCVPLVPCRYVEAVVDYLLNKSIDKHFRAFSEGFRILCDGPATRLFNAQVTSVGCPPVP